MVDTAKLAALVGAKNDEAFRLRVEAAISILETALGYSIVGTVDAEPRLFTYRKGMAWQQLTPFYAAPTLVRVNDGQDWHTIDGSQYVLSRDGILTAGWLNRLKVYQYTVKHDSVGSFRYCDMRQGMEIEVTTKWGFGEPTTEGDNTFSVVPPALLMVLAQAGKLETGLQSETVGTRTYSRFKPADVWLSNKSVIAQFANRPVKFA